MDDDVGYGYCKSRAMNEEMRFCRQAKAVQQTMKCFYLS